MDNERSRTVVAELLRCLTALGFIARHMHPPDFAAVLEAAGEPDMALRGALTDGSGALPAPLVAAAEAALAGFAGLRVAPDQADGVRAVFRALRQLPRALEALYPLAATLAAVDRCFGDARTADRRGQPPAAGTGVSHFGNERGSRGGFSLYVPEYYRPDHTWPAVMALHGGSGNGRDFLWSWLRDARTLGAIVIAPTAVGATWALMGEDDDTPNLRRILDLVAGRWNLDPARRLLSGMSDGGTFTYVSGLEPDSPFTPLAPVAASFHPMLATMADPARLRGLPIHPVHGALDWMFPVSSARQAAAALTAAGARVTYREFNDLSHCYPREIGAALLEWLDT